MNKLLQFLDKHLLKIGIAFLLIFTALYPKIPSIHIIRTWVYIRLEDFFILTVALIWFIQVIRKKAPIPFKLSLPIFAYWTAGLLSLIFCLTFIGQHLPNFFPHIVILQYLRRIEYMTLFLIAFSTVRSIKDIRDYLIILFLTITGIILYGFGQHYYIYLWSAFPKFFESYTFCFPSFQTGNEEFAKGLPLCLPEGARITSTFGGHYDLAAYLVLVLPVILTVSIGAKKIFHKILTSILFIAGVMLLSFTASRVSFAAYLIGIVATLTFYKKKWYIIPIVLLSVILLFTSSKSAVDRFAATIRISTIVTDSRGQLVGETTNDLPQALKEKIGDQPQAEVVEKPRPAQELQKGSLIMGIPEKKQPIATNVAVLKQTVNVEDAKKQNLAVGSIKISTVSGSFLMKKALVYDISFATRFQAEWPNAWKAFLRNPLLGSGYSTITLATDGDYIRALGETGVLGLITFLSIFLIFGIIINQALSQIKTSYVKALVVGLAGGGIGLLFNAALIDVFEASKVAENFWMLTGIGMGAIAISHKEALSYKKKLITLLTSNVFISLYIFLITIAVFTGSIFNFFVADDFTWLRWAATSNTTDIINYFTNSQNFFYRPLDKTIVFFLYTLFSFSPQAFHVFTIMLHLLVSLGVYFLAINTFKRKLPAFFASLIFIFLPAHAENIYWFSTISVTLSTLFITYAVLAFLKFRSLHSAFFYLITFFLAVLAFLSYELAVVLPLLLISADIFFNGKIKSLKQWLIHIPFILLIPLYFFIRLQTHAFTGGGDYSYSLPRLIPNLIGNIFGYLGVFLGGQAFLPFYAAARLTLKQFWLPITIAIILLIIGLLYAILKNKLLKKSSAIVYPLSARNLLFGLTFALISLLPYLALGNIAERYLYLSSIGFIIELIVILEKIAHLINKQEKPATITLITIILIILIFCYQQNRIANEQWKKAGEVTNKILATFRLEYPSLSPADTLYLAKIPQKLQNAWIFPVGLPDGIWFIYREKTPKIYQVQSVEEARNKIETSGSTSNYIFTIDKEGKVINVNSEKKYE